MDKTYLDRIESKLDKVAERVTGIDVTLSAQHVSLSDHIRRTEILESELKPVKQHVAYVHGALKALGLAALTLSMATGAIKVFEFFNK